MAYERLVTSRGIIFKEGKLFLQKLHSSGGANTFWSTPGGKNDPYESVVDNVRREMIEETGVVPEIGRLLFVQQFYEKEREYIEFFFHITNPDDYESIDLAHTTHGKIEVAEYGFVDPHAERVLPAFLSELDIQDYIDNEKPVYFYYENSVQAGELSS